MATVDGGAVPIDGDEETLAAVRLLVYADTPILLPEVEAELVEFANMASVESFPLERISPDDFFRGCGKAKSDAYLQFHPDPRDCHLVGEAECAQLDALVTLKTDLRNGLRERAEVSILTPVAYWGRLALPRGAEPRRHLFRVPVTERWRWSDRAALLRSSGRSRQRQNQRRGFALLARRSSPLESSRWSALMIRPRSPMGRRDDVGASF